jgi:hypothetical protein
MFMKKLIALCLLITTFSFVSCSSEAKPRLCMFVGLDISGSFMRDKYFDNSIDFMAHYLYTHLNGLGDAEIPHSLFVSSIGGAKADEPKTFFPIQTFQNKSIAEIRAKLKEIFPKNIENPYTDYNAFMEQVALTVKNKNLVLRPISIVMISDGIPDVKKDGKTDFRSIVLEPLETLSRSVTVRLLYTSAVVGKNWQTEVKRRRVKVWTQDAQVMVSWKDNNIMQPDSTFEDQARFFAWLDDNVDFGVRSRRID